MEKSFISVLFYFDRFYRKDNCFFKCSWHYGYGVFTGPGPVEVDAADNSPLVVPYLDDEAFPFQVSGSRLRSPGFQAALPHFHAAFDHHVSGGRGGVIAHEKICPVFRIGGFTWTQKH